MSQSLQYNARRGMFVHSVVPVFSHRQTQLKHLISHYGIVRGDAEVSTTANSLQGDLRGPIDSMVNLLTISSNGV